MLKIDDLGMNGEGIAHAESGKAIFLPFYLPGEELEDGKIIKVSNFRVKPKCPYFMRCGGCSLEHLNYKSALEYKQNKVKLSFKKFKLEPKVLPCVPSEKEYFYRNKLTLKCDGEKIGLYEFNSHNLVEIATCKIASEEINKIIKILKEINLKNVLEIILQSYKNNVLVTFKLKDNNFKNIILFEEKIKKIALNYGIFAYFNNNLIFKAGQEYFLKEEFNIKYYFTNNSFYQVNDEVKNKIYEKILSFVSPADIVVDAYSGSGLLSAIVARKAKNVTGIEIVKSATKNAEVLKKLNNLKNLKNINGDTKKELFSLNFNTIILDPPRAGVDKKVIEILLNKQPSKIIYVSCNPITLARDISLLKEAYDIKFLEPYDMFPQTHNVETLAVLELKTAIK